MATKQSKKQRGQRPGSMHIDKRADRLLRDPVSEGPDDEMLTTTEVAEWLGVSVQWLEIARGRGTGPKFTVLSSRQIRYRRGDVRAWLKKRAHRSHIEGRREPKRRLVYIPLDVVISAFVDHLKDLSSDGRQNAYKHVIEPYPDDAEAALESLR